MEVYVCAGFDEWSSDFVFIGIGQQYLKSTSENKIHFICDVDTRKFTIVWDGFKFSYLETAIGNNFRNHRSNLNWSCFFFRRTHFTVSELH